MRNEMTRKLGIETCWDIVEWKPGNEWTPRKKQKRFYFHNSKIRDNIPSCQVEEF